MKYYSKSTDTQDQIRIGFVNVMKQGLIPYLYDTPLSEFITVSYNQKTKRQLALPERDALVEEILLELRRLTTSYDVRLQMGFNFRFGSIYSNVVNPRFGNR